VRRTEEVGEEGGDTGRQKSFGRVRLEEERRGGEGKWRRKWVGEEGSRRIGGKRDRGRRKIKAREEENELRAGKGMGKWKGYGGEKGYGRKEGAREERKLRREDCRWEHASAYLLYLTVPAKIWLCLT